MTYVTNEMKALIGVPGPVRTAPQPLGKDTLRRFVHAAMEIDPAHSDVGYAESSRYGTLVAPPLWPMHAFVRPFDSGDPFDVLQDNPDWDGLPSKDGGTGLPPIDLPLPRLLNGGVSAEFFALAQVGDVITAQSEYSDIVEKNGKSGPMVIVSITTTYRRADGQMLARITHSSIRR